MRKKRCSCSNISRLVIFYLSNVNLISELEFVLFLLILRMEKKSYQKKICICSQNKWDRVRWSACVSFKTLFNLTFIFLYCFGKLCVREGGSVYRYLKKKKQKKKSKLIKKFFSQIERKFLVLFFISGRYN